jgi:hypothetical protein
LDKFMPALKGMCPYHFVAEGKLVPDHHATCECKNALLGAGDYHTFKMAFNFEKYAYCFTCGMPQDKKKNGEGPSCHGVGTFAKGKACMFGPFIFRATFCLWQLPEWRSKMAACLGLGNTIATQQQFIEWAVAEKDDEGKYHNCLEAFLWFCRRMEAKVPSFFL